MYLQSCTQLLHLLENISYFCTGYIFYDGMICYQPFKIFGQETIRNKCENVIINKSSKHNAEMFTTSVDVIFFTVTGEYVIFFTGKYVKYFLMIITNILSTPITTIPDNIVLYNIMPETIKNNLCITNAFLHLFYFYFAKL